MWPALLDQDGLTCAYPGNAIQDVLMVLYIILNAAGERVYNKHSYHFWDDKLDNNGDTNTAYHAVCIRYIIERYKKLYADDLQRGLQSVLIFTDGWTV